MAIRSGFSRQRSRQRRRAMFRAVLWLAGAGVFIAIGYASYRSGAILARLEVQSLDEEIVRLTRQSEGLRVENDRLRIDLTQTRQAAEGLKRRYDADVPSGAMAGLVALSRERMAAGVRDDRIAQVLRDTENTRPCEGRQTRKRFTIHVVGQGTEESISFLDGLLQVSASVPPTNEDITKATTITVTRLWTGQAVRQTGFPLRQSIVINNLELKLVVEPSDLRGYGMATLSVCGKG